MRLGLNSTNRGLLVRSAAEPEATTRKRLNHSMVSIGFLRASCKLIWPTPSAMPSATDSGMLSVSRKTPRNRIVDAKSRSRSLPAFSRFLTVGHSSLPPRVYPYPRLRQPQWAVLPNPLIAPLFRPLSALALPQVRPCDSCRRLPFMTQLRSSCAASAVFAGPQQGAALRTHRRLAQRARKVSSAAWLASYLIMLLTPRRGF